MQTRFPSHRTHTAYRWMRRSTHTVLIACGGLFIAACQSPESPKAAAPTPDAFTIHIDRGDNGAVEGGRNQREDKRTILPRVLAFEMSGVAEKGGRHRGLRQRAH